MFRIRVANPGGIVCGLLAEGHRVALGVDDPSLPLQATFMRLGFRV